MRVRKPTLTREGIATLRRNTHRVEISKPEIRTGHHTQVKVLTTEPGATAPVPDSRLPSLNPSQINAQRSDALEVHIVLRPGARCHSLHLGGQALFVGGAGQVVVGK